MPCAPTKELAFYSLISLKYCSESVLRGFRIFEKVDIACDVGTNAEHLNETGCTDRLINRFKQSMSYIVCANLMTDASNLRADLQKVLQLKKRLLMFTITDFFTVGFWTPWLLLPLSSN